MPLHFTARQCRCGRPLDACGHHRSTCAVAGVLGRRGYPLETAAAKVCRDAGARVRLNTMVRDLDLLLGALLDNRRSSKTVCPCSTGHNSPSTLQWCQPSDATAQPEEGPSTPVEPPSFPREGGNNSPIPSCLEMGVVQDWWCWPRKWEGRWSQEARQFLVALAQAKSREAPPPLQGSVKAAWLHRWSFVFACTAARSFALSFVDGLAPGVNGPTPSVNDMLLWDMRHM